ncbi:hypothetical protein Tco_1566486, partial [Tanacetum coccineum]
TKDKIDAGDSEKEDESAQDCFELPIWHSYSSTNKSASKSDTKRGGPREEEQVFLDDLARLQRQEKEANEEAEALRKSLEQETENLVTQAGAAKFSDTNIFSTVSTTAKAIGTKFVNTVSIPVSTASANERLSLSETTNSQEDDNEIPPLEDIHEDTTDVMFKSKGETIIRTFIIVYLLVFYLNMNPRRFLKLLKMKAGLMLCKTFLPCSTFLPTDVKHCLNVGKSWLLFKSKKIAQAVRAWIQSKNSLVKHFDDMRLCRPSKEYLQVWFNPPRDGSMSCLTTKGMRTIGVICA